MSTESTTERLFPPHAAVMSVMFELDGTMKHQIGDAELLARALGRMKLSEQHVGEVSIDIAAKVEALSTADPKRARYAADLAKVLGAVAKVVEANNLPPWQGAPKTS